jgi:glycosyltransferase involved in cell wall biosynthesis
LANCATEDPSSPKATASTEHALRVLVISDAFPNPATDGPDLRLMQTLRKLREQGNELTFIAREALNRTHCEPLLHQIGIHTYGNDSERLPVLGAEANDADPSWSFRELFPHPGVTQLPVTSFEYNENLRSKVSVIDDGSSDATQELLAKYRPPFQFQYLRQENSGTGAARRNGVAHAKGEYLLLMNDDTICNRDLLTQHLQVHRKYATERWAVLGNFEYPAAARQRALTQYFCVEPFMFPQVSMEEACPYGYSHFITCNLSVRRDAVKEAGSFDSTYKLSEDTELGIRLFEQGYRVLYHPDAHAFHDHLPYPARNLIRRARVYGEDYFYMFGRHPRVMKEWAMPVNLTGMDEENAIRILEYVEEQRHQVEQAVEAVERWDSVDFEILVAEQAETAAMVLRLFQQAVPAIHWFYLFETMLHTMIRELRLNHMTAKPPAMQAAHSAGA